MFGYTRNSRFGATKNPLGPVTVGGSSGGEAAAIASGCSALGVGTDFGGSVRWPAHCTGTVALRPTAGRVAGTGQLPCPSLREPLIGNETTFQGRLQIVGPLARSAHDLELALHVMAGPDGIDPFAVPAPLAWSRRPPERVTVWEGPASPMVRDDVRSVGPRGRGDHRLGRGGGERGGAGDARSRGDPLLRAARDRRAPGRPSTGRGAGGRGRRGRARGHRRRGAERRAPAGRRPVVGRARPPARGVPGLPRTLAGAADAGGHGAAVRRVGPGPRGRPGAGHVGRAGRPTG